MSRSKKSASPDARDGPGSSEIAGQQQLIAVAPNASKGNLHMALPALLVCGAHSKPDSQL